MTGTEFLGDLGKDDDLSAGQSQSDRPKQTYPCVKCRGTGKFMSIIRGDLSECFGCHGTGQSKYPPEQQADRRAKSRASAQKARVTIGNKAADWKEQHKVEYEWLLRSAANNDERGGTFTFPRSILEVLETYGKVSDAQMATIQKLLARDGERTKERAVQQAERVAAAPPVATSKIEEAFDAARDNDIKWPALHLHSGGYTFTFKPARKHPGTLYVTVNGDEYLGKVTEGKLLCIRECTPDQREQIIAAMNDPEQAATAYGKRTGTCGCCGRPLTNGESIDRGIGPICAEKYGW